MLFKQTTHADQAAPHADPLPSTKLPSALLAGSGPEAAARSAPQTRMMMPADSETDKRLIVGQGIQLKGEITACERLIVEGQVEVTMNATRSLEIKPTGHFIGSCEVEDAEISGIYEGDLSVRGRLSVRSGGRVVGKISYGELELERGGEIAGELSVRNRQRGQVSSPPSGPRPGATSRSAAAA